MNEFFGQPLGILTKARADALYAALAPSSNARNVIQPTGDYTPLTLRRNASGSTAATLLIGDEASGSVAAIKADGSYEYNDVGGGSNIVKWIYGSKGYVPSGTEIYQSLRLLPSITPTTNTTARLWGAVFSPTVAGSGNVNLIYGAEFLANSTGSGTIAELNGIQVSANNTGAAPITLAYGIRAQINQGNPSTGSVIATAYGVHSTINIQASAAGSITNAYHFYGKPTLGGAGTITNLYGLYLENISGGSTLNYAILTNLGKVQFGDNLVITGNRSYTSWTTNGKGLDIQAATLTDSSGSGTIALRTINSFAIPTLAATSSEILTLTANVYIAGAPVASTNVTQMAKAALLIDTGADASIGVIIRGNSATQSADIFRVTKSDGTIYFKVDGSGNATISVAKLANLTSNGFVKTSGGDGTLSVASIVSADITTALTTPSAIGSVTPSTGAFTTLSASGDLTLSGAPGRIKPASNSTTAIEVTKVDGTVVATFDTSTPGTTLAGVTGSQGLKLTATGIGLDNNERIFWKTTGGSYVTIFQYTAGDSSALRGGTGGIVLQNSGGNTFLTMSDAGTFTLRNGIASTGVTQVNIQAGAGQSATNLLQFNNSSGTLQLALAANGRDFVLDTTTGTKWGTATSQKQAWYNATPIIQPASANQAAVVTTPAALASYGFTQSQADSIVTLVNQLRSDLVSLGLIKGAA